MLRRFKVVPFLLFALTGTMFVLVVLPATSAPTVSPRAAETPIPSVSPRVADALPAQAEESPHDHSSHSHEDSAEVQTPPTPSAAVVPVPPSRQITNSALLTANRDRLEICVEVVSPARAAPIDARQHIERALSQVTQHRSWRSARFGIGPPTVTTGCPGDPFLLRPGVTVLDGSPSGSTRFPRVSDASRYRLFVFVLSDQELKRVIQGVFDVRTVTQEMLCYGRTCIPVSLGLYFSNSELANQQFLQDRLAQGLGLEHPIPDGPESSHRPTSR